MVYFLFIFVESMCNDIWACNRPLPTFHPPFQPEVGVPIPTPGHREYRNICRYLDILRKFAGYRSTSLPLYWNEWMKLWAMDAGLIRHNHAHDVKGTQITTIINMYEVVMSCYEKKNCTDSMCTTSTTVQNVYVCPVQSRYRTIQLLYHITRFFSLG